MAKRLPPDKRPAPADPGRLAVKPRPATPVAAPATAPRRSLRPATASTLRPAPQKASDARPTQAQKALAMLPAPRPAPLARTDSKTAKPLTSWSYSRYRDWVQCPLMFKLKHIEKRTEAPSGPMLRGIDIGTRLEGFLKNELVPLPPECAPLSDLYHDIRDMKPLVEQMWGLDRDWNPVAWNDWNACWLRIKMDIAYQDKRSRTAYILDNKTGKFKEQETEVYLEQLDIYVAGAPAYFPTAKTFAPRLLYSDLGIQYPDLDDQGLPTFTYTLAEAKSAQMRWEQNVKPMFADTRYAPRPGRYCQWCSFSKAKGGPCEY